MITRFRAKNFTAFTDIDANFSEGINIFIGANGTGKTHIMKAIYSACCLTDEKEKLTLEQKLFAVFRPNSIGRLVHRSVGRNSGWFEVHRKNHGSQTEHSIRCTITSINHVETRTSHWTEDRRNSATFIPVKDMLANAPGFRSLYNNYHLLYEEIYADIIDKALLPYTRRPQSSNQKKLLSLLAGAISGRVVEKNEHFFLKNKHGELEFTLLAEGFRKLGLLYALIQNGTLTNGSILFWDEPESNLNPKLSNTVVKILMALQEMGIQIFLATHDYVLLKEFSFERTDKTPIRYHNFSFNDDQIILHSADTLEDLSGNAIEQEYDSLLDRDISRNI